MFLHGKASDEPGKWRDHADSGKVAAEAAGKGIIMALDFPVGHAVEAMENGTTRIGHVVAEADSVEALDNIVRKVYRCIFVDGTSLEELWRK